MFTFLVHTGISTRFKVNLLCAITSCDYVCSTNRGIFVERIEKDNSFISKMLIFSFFLTKYLLPELLTCNLELEHSDSDKENEVSACVTNPSLEV